MPGRSTLILWLRLSFLQQCETYLDDNATLMNSATDPSISISASSNDNAEDNMKECNLLKRKHKKRKEKNGRLKKLWRRSTGSPPGITSRAEWLELIDLHADLKHRHSVRIQLSEEPSKIDALADCDTMLEPLSGPSIVLSVQKSRDFRNVEEWQCTEGSNHRDILANLLFAPDVCLHKVACENMQKKMKTEKLFPTGGDSDELESDNQLITVQNLVNIPNLPSWAAINNLASVAGVAIIEIDINNVAHTRENEEHCPLMPSQLIKRKDDRCKAIRSLFEEDNNSLNEPKVRRSVGAACKVQLFQGDTFPQRMTDVLMFLPPPSPSKLKLNRLKKKQSNGLNVGNHSEIFRAMYDLKLTMKQLRCEGFPIEVERKESDRPNPDLSLHFNLAKKKLRSMAGCLNIDSSSEVPLVKTKTFDISEEDAIKLSTELSTPVELGCGENLSIETNDDSLKTEFYVKTFSCDSATPSRIKRKPEIFAIDCEMVQTIVGPELARVSVVLLNEGNSDMSHSKISEERIVVVFDELVKPRRKVLDYLTEFSGITPTMLVNINTRIEVVQAHLLSLIHENDIIVGHSLENDMKALRLLHYNIVDTSVLFKGSSGRKYGLRHLSNVLLNKQIQKGCGSTGHCSIEDAKAALVLALQRAKYGPSFCLKENVVRENIFTIFQNVNLAYKHSCRCYKKYDDADQLIECIESFAGRNQGPCVCIGGDEWISKYAKINGGHHVLTCDSLRSTMSMAIPSWLSNENPRRRAGLLWANLNCSGSSKDIHQELKRLDELIVGSIMS